MMYLLDTHVALWLLEGNEKLSQKAREIIFAAENEIYISIVSAWEIAIKVSLNKLDFEGGTDVFFSSVKKYEIDIFGIKNEHIIAVEKLPYIHRDPFDRLLVSTATVDELTIITADENIRKYGVMWTW